MTKIMTRTEMIAFIRENPNIPITHPLFSPDEYIVALENENVIDESGYLFEDWYSHEIYGWNGIRERIGGSWEDGWRVKE